MAKLNLSSLAVQTVLNRANNVVTNNFGDAFGLRPPSRQNSSDFSDDIPIIRYLNRMSLQYVFITVWVIIVRAIMTRAHYGAVMDSLQCGCGPLLYRSLGYGMHF